MTDILEKFVSGMNFGSRRPIIDIAFHVTKRADVYFADSPNPDRDAIASAREWLSHPQTVPLSPSDVQRISDLAEGYLDGDDE